MRKVSVVLIFIMSCCLCSCSLSASGGWYNDQTIANQPLEEILEMICSGDSGGLRSLFAEESIQQSEYFEDSMDALFDYVNGDLVAYDDWGGPSEEKSREDDEVFVQMEFTYDVETTEDRYRFAFRAVTDDTANSKNVGMHSLYVIRYADDLCPQYAYWGDGNFTPGIHVGIPNTE